MLQVGLIMGTASLAGVLVRPWVGRALDRAGRRVLLIAGGIGFMIANFSYLALHEKGWTIYAVRLLHGFAMGMLTATFFTLAADLVPPEKRTEGIALFGISGHLAGAIGVVLAEQVLDRGGFRLLFAVCTVLSGLTILVSLAIRKYSGPREGGNLKGFTQIAFSRFLRAPALATLSFAVGLISYMVFLKPFAGSICFGSATSFFVAYSTTAVVVRLIGADRPDRFGLKRVLYPAMVSFAAGIVSIFLRPSLGAMIASGILCGVGHGFIYPILSVMMVWREGSANRGSAMTFFTMLYDLGVFIGASLLGWIVERHGYAAMFVIAALIVVTSLGVLLFFDRGWNAPTLNDPD